MRYLIDTAIFGTLPDYTRAVLVARELDNTQNVAASRNMLRKAMQAAGGTFANRASAGHPHLATWMRAYDAFGLTNALQVQVEAQPVPTPLLPGPDHTPLMNILSAFSLQHVLPVGGDDLDRIGGNVWLRPARGRELFIPIGRPERPEAPGISEIVYVDDGPNVLRRFWHGPTGDTARITSETRNALIYLDCLPPVDQAKAEDLAGKLAKLVSGFLGAHVETHFLTRDQPAVEIQL